MGRTEFEPMSYDEDGNPIEDTGKDENGRFTKGHKSFYEGKKFDSEKFKELFHLYNTLDSRGKRMLSKQRFARELGVTIPTLDRHLKSLLRDGRLDQQFKDDAVLQIKKSEDIDTPSNILARMGIMGK